MCRIGRWKFFFEPPECGHAGCFFAGNSPLNVCVSGELLTFRAGLTQGDVFWDEVCAVKSKPIQLSYIVSSICEWGGQVQVWWCFTESCINATLTSVANSQKIPQIDLPARWTSIQKVSLVQQCSTADVLAKIQHFHKTQVQYFSFLLRSSIFTSALYDSLVKQHKDLPEWRRSISELIKIKTFPTVFI